jgi:hypothetical protein
MMKTLRNEKGIALVMVLVLALISLAIVASLVYMVLQGTKSSGFLKRYESAREAGMGGTEIVAALISDRGQLVIPEGTPGKYYVNYPNRCDCGMPDVLGDNSPNTCLCRKLCDTTASWVAAGCDDSFDPRTNPDIPTFELPGIGGNNYEVSMKIVDTTLGNSDLSGEDLGGTCVACGGGEVPVSPAPYLYRIEVNTQLKTNPIERSRLSVLYGY